MGSSPTPPPVFLVPSSSIPTLLGRSNFTHWHDAVHPILISHPTASALLSGSWPVPSSTITFQDRAVALADCDLANQSICRFIRAHLAMNVLPFVSGFTEAKALWEMLVGLYGEANGIEMAGGMGHGGMKFAPTSVGATHCKKKLVMMPVRQEGDRDELEAGGNGDGKGKGKERDEAVIVETQVSPEGHEYDRTYTKERKASKVEAPACEEDGLLVGQSRPLNPKI